MSARESLKGGTPTDGSQNSFIMTLLGPKGIKNKLTHSFCFMGRMRALRPIEFTLADANQAEQMFKVDHPELEECKNQMKEAEVNENFGQTQYPSE